MKTGDESILENLIAADAMFYSPAVYSPQLGRTKVCAYLIAAERMFADTNFRYTAQWISSHSAALEFDADLDGVYTNGVDLITWNDDNEIVSFKVMIRPLRGLRTVIPLMGSLLASRESE